MRSLTTGNSATRERRHRAHRARMETERPGESPGSIRLTRRDQRSSIPRHAHAPAPHPPSRRWSISYIAFALVPDGDFGTPIAPRFRLGLGYAPLHCGLRCAMRSAPILRSAPARRPLDRSVLEPISVTAQAQGSKGMIRTVGTHGQGDDSISSRQSTSTL